MPETLFLTVNLIDRFLAEKQVGMCTAKGGGRP